jgi:predicted nucleic-acid-binding protein
LIGLDTNVLVRYLAQDDTEQSARATALIEQRLTAEEPGYIGIVAMVETVWVLDRAYRMDGTEIAAIVERLLQADALSVEAAQEVFLAMLTLRDGRGGFADALIALLGTRAGCLHTATFDRKALRISGFAPL